MPDGGRPMRTMGRPWQLLMAVGLALCAAGAAGADSHLPPADGAPYDPAGVLYRDGDFRLARPGQRPVSNFYNRPGYVSVDPACYAGVLSMELSAEHPAFPGARMHVAETIRVRPTRVARRHAQRFSWEIWSDPFEMMGIVTTAQGAGGGSARVWLTLDLRNAAYRLVTDVTPRRDAYRIDSAGAGLSRTAQEDIFFGFADHHYSYVDLSGLAGAGAAGAQAMADIDRMLSNRPPNVVMGFIDWTEIEGADGSTEVFIELQREEEMFLDYHGLILSGLRRTDLRILCDDVIRDIRRLWPR
ncbi:hypothetical protein HCU73_16855 [Roseibacterium sp. KMU-115]|uniref:Uncharacterized protein n=2 Tax=Roseicyclus persicicus TaxID=2650661 RepID=A0A7X6H1K9_9RHOB|nr:hypothetical protein [Roseibacterium persicicum]